MPIGLFEEPSFERHQVELDEKFELFLFSDGILEVLGGDNLDEKEQNLRTLCERAGQTPEAILQTVTAEVETQPDDVAVMMVSRR
jgi:serine phosphatase RsbU (regulator of sigma subunit)